MGDSDRKSILLVDDSRAVRQLVKFMISRHIDSDIQEAGDGVEAVDKIKDQDFDLVITDINMPNMDGLSLVKKVREEMDLKVPIIIVTTMGKEQDRDAGLNLGANSYVTKPIQAPELMREVTNLLG